MKLEVELGTKVTLHFALVLEDGDVIDSNFETAPATFTVGDGNLLPGFESTLIGLENGDEREFTIPPEEAFGQHNLQNVQRVDRSNFDQQELEVGAMFSFPPPLFPSYSYSSTTDDNLFTRFFFFDWLKN